MRLLMMVALMVALGPSVGAGQGSDVAWMSEYYRTNGRVVTSHGTNSYWLNRTSLEMPARCSLRAQATLILPADTTEQLHFIDTLNLSGQSIAIEVQTRLDVFAVTVSPDRARGAQGEFATTFDHRPLSFPRSNPTVVFAFPQRLQAMEFAEALRRAISQCDGKVVA